MKAAIPLLGSMVAPRFDAASWILLITIDKGKLVQKEEVSVSPGPLITRINRLMDLNPDVLICGNIDGFSGRMIAGRGIKLIPWITGETKEVIEKYLAGSLEPEMGREPGTYCRKRNRFRPDCPKGGKWGKRRGIKGRK